MEGFGPSPLPGPKPAVHRLGSHRQAAGRLGQADSLVKQSGRLEATFLENESTTMLLVPSWHGPQRKHPRIYRHQLNHQEAKSRGVPPSW